MQKQALKLFLQNKWVKITIVLNIFLLLVTLIIILINIKPISNRSYIIYYTSLEGIKVLGYFWNFYLFWFVAFFFFVLYFFFAFIIWFRNKNISYLLLSSAILLNFFIFLAINSLVIINR